MELLGRVSTKQATLEQQVATLEQQVATLLEEKTRLEEQLHLNSRHSHQPSSQDKPGQRVVSSRAKGVRRPGGQPGHRGSTLAFKDDPTERVVVSCDRCAHCNEALSKVSAIHHVRRQVWDTPEVREPEVIEYLLEVKVCPRCKKQTTAPAPEGVTSPVQYGPRVSALAAWLHFHQGVPYERCSRVLETLWGIKISVATLEAFGERLLDRLSPYLAELLTEIKQQPVVHCDETGIRLNSKIVWVHVISTGRYTYLSCGPQRGFEGMKSHLSGYGGTVVHDGWASYRKWNCAHALCNAHHLRELRFLAEVRQHAWASDFADLLVEFHERVKVLKSAGQTALTAEDLVEFHRRYDEAIAAGLAACPEEPPEAIPKKGRKRASKERNLLKRLQEHKGPTCAFAADFSIPFDNNQAERDLRMLKVVLKTYGTFRSQIGVDIQLALRSFIETCRKNQGQGISALVQILTGNFQWHFAQAQN